MSSFQLAREMRDVDTTRTIPTHDLLKKVEHWIQTHEPGRSSSVELLDAFMELIKTFEFAVAKFNYHSFVKRYDADSILDTRSPAMTRSRDKLTSALKQLAGNLEEIHRITDWSTA